MLKVKSHQKFFFEFIFLISMKKKPEQQNDEVRVVFYLCIQILKTRSNNNKK